MASDALLMKDPDTIVAKIEYLPTVCLQPLGAVNFFGTFWPPALGELHELDITNCPPLGANHLTANEFDFVQIFVSLTIRDLQCIVAVLVLWCSDASVFRCFGASVLQWFSASVLQCS
jgi:hypothetical protein